MHSNNEDSRYLCTTCYGGYVPLARIRLGRTTCLPCGEQIAKKTRHTVCNLPKSNYILITDLNDLKGLNKYAKD